MVFITTGGYDTHDNQVSRHAALLKDLDRGIEAFDYGTRDGPPITTGGVADDARPRDLGTVPQPGTPIGPVDPALAARTLIVTFGEFGRRIGDDGSGTDHGAAAPMLFVGLPAPAAGSGAPTLVPGLHRDHPSLGSLRATADNLGKDDGLPLRLPGHPHRVAPRAGGPGVHVARRHRHRQPGRGHRTVRVA